MNRLATAKYDFVVGFAFRISIFVVAGLFPSPIIGQMISNPGAFEKVEGVVVWHDESGTQTPEEVIMGLKESEWESAEFIPGPETGVYWVRFSLRNNLQSGQKFALSFDRWEKIEGYLIRDAQVQQFDASGRTKPFFERRTRYELGQELRLSLQPGESETIWARLEHTGTASLFAFTFDIHVAPELVAESEDVFRMDLIFITLAILIFILIYNLFFYVSTREHRYRFYLIHMFVVVLELARRGGFLNFLWWDSPLGPEYDHYLYLVLNLLATVLVLPLFLDYLDVGKLLPRWAFRLKLTLIPAFLLAFVAYFSQSLFISLGATAMILVAPLFLYVNILLLKKQHPMAVFFLPAMLVFDVGTILHGASQSGWIHLGEVGEIIARFDAMIVVDAILSYGLGRRVFLLSKENEAKQLELIASLQDQRKAKIALGRKILEVQEKVRDDIANQLHDDVQSLLVSIRFNLMASRPAPKDSEGPANSGLEFSLEQLKKAIQMVRKISHDLRPTSLSDPRGLEVSIENFLHLEEADSRITFSYENPQPLPDGIRTLAYRVVQALVEDIKAVPDHQKIDLRIIQSELTLEIRGNLPIEITGFEVGAPEDRARGTMQVLELFSGQVSQGHTPNGKPSIVITIPIESQNQTSGGAG